MSISAVKKACFASNCKNFRQFSPNFSKPKSSFLATLPAFGARSFSASPTPELFCFQCEQTKDQKGCSSKGVCGKTPETGVMQDLLIESIKGVAVFASAAAKLGKRDRSIDIFALEAVFSTLTNVNFDESRIEAYVRKSESVRDAAKQLYLKACEEKNQKPDESVLKNNIANMPSFKNDTLKDLERRGGSVGVLSRQKAFGADLSGLQEMAMYGLKGTMAYAEHAMRLGQEDPKVFERLFAALATLANPNPTVPLLFDLCMEVGDINLRVLELLDQGHTSKFGHPEITNVNCAPKPGKCILVSGHDMVDLEAVLKLTQNTDINVYTHGELLPANAYPEFKKYKNLAGNFGSAWQNQKFEFAQFPGPILMTTNCLVEPMKSYRNRIFTTNVTGFEGVRHLSSHAEFSELIASAKSCEGFTEENIEDSALFRSLKKPITIGFARNQIMAVANQVVSAVQSGKIKRFFVIGGCDGSETERNYFTDLASQTAKDTIILTLGCGKYRFNRKDLGTISLVDDGSLVIPRVLDLGQCNDSFSAIQIAVTLAQVFKVKSVNDLPISFAISWFEQKAVAVLLSLLKLDIKNIHMGPHLPAFVTPTVLGVLQSKFQLQQVDMSAGGGVSRDLEKMMNGK